MKTPLSRILYMQLDNCCRENKIGKIMSLDRMLLPIFVLSLLLWPAAVDKATLGLRGSLISDDLDMG